MYVSRRSDNRKSRASNFFVRKCTDFAYAASEMGMKARRLIEGASSGPDTLKPMGEAFGQGRVEIIGNFGTLRVEIEAARLSLAELSIATEGSTNVAALIVPLKRWSGGIRSVGYGMRLRKELARA